LNTAHKTYLADPSIENANVLFADIARYARALCLKRGVSREDAADTAQDAALAVWTKLHQYDPARSAFRTWVHRCTLDQISINRRNSDARLKDTVGQQLDKIPIPTSRSRIADLRVHAGDNAELIDLILVFGDLASAANHLGLTLLAAQKRLKRLGRKINLEERSIPSC